jgi:hypothetical protein
MENGLWCIDQMIMKNYITSQSVIYVYGFEGALLYRYSPCIVLAHKNLQAHKVINWGQKE